MASPSQNCPACGFPNHPDNPFCSNCGRSVINRPQNNAALRQPNNRTPANNRNIPKQFAGTQATNKIFGVHYGLVIAAGVILSIFLMGLAGALNPAKTEPSNSRSLYASNAGNNSVNTSGNANHNSYSSGSNNFAGSNASVNSNTSIPTSLNAASVAGLIVGNRQLKTYYRRNCLGYDDVPAESRVVFKTVGKAATAGYRAAESCGELEAARTTSAPSTGGTVVSTRKSAPAPKPAKSDASGASARCRDGSLSYSQSRRGTCSHHGGVAEWF